MRSREDIEDELVKLRDANQVQIQEIRELTQERDSLLYEVGQKETEIRVLVDAIKRMEKCQ